jgi:hypothetical protein
MHFNIFRIGQGSPYHFPPRPTQTLTHFNHFHYRGEYREVSTHWGNFPLAVRCDSEDVPNLSSDFHRELSYRFQNHLTTGRQDVTIVLLPRIFGYWEKVKLWAGYTKM